MDLEELEPRKQQPQKKNLEALSLEALGDYIAELEAEIARARETIAAKERAQREAQGVFKA